MEGFGLFDKFRIIAGIHSFSAFGLGRSSLCLTQGHNDLLRGKPLPAHLPAFLQHVILNYVDQFFGGQCRDRPKVDGIIPAAC
jgi:hypothetical protein